MKKSLIALAVLAASGAAMAQSSVTIGGNIGLGFVKQTGKTGTIDASNGYSNLSFRGVEDLGGGLKANFNLTHRFSPESGGLDGSANKRPFWQSRSTVGLSGNFGAVDIGRSLTAAQGILNSSDPWTTYTQASVAVLATNYSTDGLQADGAGAGRTDHIMYTSPNFSGFSGALSLGTKNSAASGAAVTQAHNLTSLNLQYGNGPVWVGFAAEENRTGDKVHGILGSYDFGVAKLMAGYAQVDTIAITTGPKGKNWNLAVQAPLGAATLKAGYSNAKAEGTAVKTTKVGIGAEYALSKRTYLFTGYGRTKKDLVPSVTGFDLGINHAF